MTITSSLIRIDWLEGFSYLATPYSDSDALVRERRFLVVNAVAAKLMAAGCMLISPISHTHPIAIAGDLPCGWDFWGKYDRQLLECCDRVLVVTQAGWQNSVGLAGELSIAKELGLPVEYLDPKLWMTNETDDQ